MRDYLFQKVDNDENIVLCPKCGRELVRPGGFSSGVFRCGACSCVTATEWYKGELYFTSEEFEDGYVFACFQEDELPGVFIFETVARE